MQELQKNGRLTTEYQIKFFTQQANLATNVWTNKGNFKKLPVIQNLI